MRLAIGQSATCCQQHNQLQPKPNRTKPKSDPNQCDFGIFLMSSSGQSGGAVQASQLARQMLFLSFELSFGHQTTLTSDRSPAWPSAAVAAAAKEDLTKRID